MSASPDLSAVLADSDAEQLRKLGYTSNFNRSMSLWENFALGFTYLSPVVGVYTLFGLCLAAGGPPMFWAYLLVGCGQLLVCLIFGEVVSQFPISGGVYPWARRLVGKRWAWMVGWIYSIALCVTIAAVAVGAGPYLAAMMGFEPSNNTNIIIALVLTLFATLVNLSGTKVLARIAMFGFLCELVGAVIVGVYLLIFERHQSISVLFNTFDISVDGSYLPAFLTASLAGMFLYYGFEACGDVAEETPNPSKRIPVAMRMTIYIGGISAMFACLALILAVPDMQAVINGTDKDPVTTILNNAFGPVGSKVVMGVVMISFISCVISLQAAASRLLYSYARDEMVIGSRLLKKISPYDAGSGCRAVRLRCPAGADHHPRLLPAGCSRHHRQLRGHRHLPGVPDDRARGPVRPHEGLETKRQIHPRRLGLGGEHRRTGLWCRGHYQHGLATDTGCRVVHQLRHGTEHGHRDWFGPALHVDRQAV
ncbi:UNVERIFIED_ORG: amino acid transporter [Pseudomonas reinekei]|nr:amino acid transporter [Pseudomonas reinekei]